MGGANNICSDKTGTLTMNIMTWVKVWSGVSQDIKEDTGFDAVIPTPKVQELLKQAVCCNTVGTVEDSGATDKAMLKLMARWNVDTKDMRSKLLPKNPRRFPFDSKRKRMSTVVELPPGELTYPKRLHTKGASEIILATCTSYLDAEGNKQPLNDQVMSQLTNQIEAYAKEALRTIAFAYRDLSEGQGGADHDAKSERASHLALIEDVLDGQEGFTLIAIAGIKDIIRKEVPSAVKQCNKAGIRVRMVTGDNIITARAIAKECGILRDSDEMEDNVCMTGPDFCEFVGGIVHKKTGEPIEVLGKEAKLERIGNLDNMKIVRQKLKVLARSRPNDKYIMVAGLTELGDIVAVTGDGTNDAPALKRADVGFAMQTGTQVAKSAGDIIIQDDNFASIVKACSWGRNVFDNIRRFLQFQLTVNVCALIIAFIGGVVMAEPPLTAIQFLWVNMIMDTLAALALATEDPKPELL